MTYRISATLLLGVSFTLGTGITSSAYGSAPIYGLAKNFQTSSFIVVLKENPYRVFATEQDYVAYQAEQIQDIAEIQIQQTFSAALSGFAVKADPEQIKTLAQAPNIDFIEVDDEISISSEQDNPPWGLDRIDSREGLDEKYEYSASGTDVHVYVIDTGIFTEHADFEERARDGFSSIKDRQGPEDCHGHGTHVAGTIAGKSYGVAKSALVHPVRVLDCQGRGQDSGVIAGIDWVAQNAEFPAVANMSLGGGKSRALDQAVQRAIKKGIVFVVAAGNDNRDACSYSPANVDEAITVGATTRDDKRSSFSNHGSCVDVFAPGSDVLSAWLSSKTAKRVLSGTSMASPHVAGVAALYLEDHPESTPEEVFKAVVKTSTAETIKNVGFGSPNLLVYSKLEAEPEPEPEPEPDPDNPCGDDCASKAGTLTQGQSLILPESGQFRASGTLQAYLVGSDATNFDLFLERRHWLFGWRQVASATNPDSTESLRYRGRNALYRWVVKARSGSGKFVLWANQGL